MKETEFVERLYWLLEFDENASVRELRELADQIHQVHALWLGGDPIHPPELQAHVNQYYTECDATARARVAATLVQLENLVLFNVEAQKERLAGRIQAAEAFEAQKERKYRGLPSAWKW